MYSSAPVVVRPVIMIVIGMAQLLMRMRQLKLDTEAVVSPQVTNGLSFLPYLSFI